MKANKHRHYGLLALLLLLALNSPAATEYHDFLCKDGRTFRGRIVAYDHHAEIVSILQDNKRLIKVSPSIFDEADQLHIKEWNIIRCFQSESLFKISAGRGPSKTKKTEGHPHTTYTYYTISLENRSNVTLKNLSIEYHIYYHHEKNQSVQCGKIWIYQLAPKSKKREEKTENIPLRIGNFWTYQEVDVDGIWIRATLPLSGDRKVVREYCLPDNISKHKKWAETDIPIGRKE